MGLLRHWVLKSLQTLDKVGNFLTGGKKWETISSRMGKALLDPNTPWLGREISKGLCWLLDKVDPDHCINSIERERVELERMMDKLADARAKLRLLKRRFM